MNMTVSSTPSELSIVRSRIVKSVDPTKHKTTTARLSIHQLKVDHSYQRGIREKSVREILSDFDELAIGVIYVSNRGNDNFYILDGQTRVEACKKNGSPLTIQAYVMSGLSLADEAGLYLKFNEGRHDPTAVELYKAALVHGDEETIQLTQVLDKNGVYIRGGAHSKTTYHTEAVAILYKKFQKNAAALDQALGLLVKAWEPEDKPLKGPFISGMASFCEKYGSMIKEPMFIRKLQRVRPEGIDRLAKKYNLETGQNSTDRSYMYALHKTYNEDLQNKLPSMLET